MFNSKINLAIGEYIEDPKFGLGKILSIDDSTDLFSCLIDFDIGTRKQYWNISDIENVILNKQPKEKIEEYLKFRNYELGEQRYLTRAEMEGLKPGDLVLRNRKGFARILSFGKDEAGKDIMHLEYLESGEKNKFNRYDSCGLLIRFSFKYDINNEFWEKKQEKKLVNLTSDDFNEIEQEFNISLPNFYKIFLINYPDELLYYNRSRLSRKELFYELEILNQKSELIQNNYYFEAFDQPEFWPIGNDGLGNYYAIKINGESENIYFIDHEVEGDSLISEFAANFDQLIINLLMREMESSYSILNK